MTEIRAVGFDLDGTLFDHLNSATAGVNAFLRSLGVEPTDAIRTLWFSAEEAGYEQWRSGQISFQEQRRYRLNLVLPAVGIAPPDNPAGLDMLFAEYLREYRAAWRAFPGAADVLISLRASGIRLGVLTNGSQEQQVDKLQAIGLQGLVDVVCTAEDLGVWKPDERAFEVLAGKLGVTPAECLFVGDHPEQDVAGAMSAGMHAVLVDHYGEHAVGLKAVIDEGIGGR
ncbi:HAD family hydrolase [Microlunatus sp. GCM10028923]|uniref:HAD family hydrolase n=1 Tax=Microlunatus sp. GCM10028923 TaxID=3273400 RepID=UPI00361E70BF